MLRDLQQLPQAIQSYLQSLEPRHPFVVPDDKLEMFHEEVKQYRSRRVQVPEIRLNPYTGVAETSPGLNA